MKGNTGKYISILTVTAMLFCMTSCGEEERQNGTSHTVQNAESLSQNEYTKLPTKLSKKEAVFVTISSDGSVTGITVTDRLTADSAKVRVDDISSLTDIKNIKGTEQPQTDGENLVWNMDNADLYYSGKTEKSLPAEIGIKYNLNNEEISADEIEGESGRLEIEITSENKMFSSVEQNGKIMKIYTPFLIVGGMMLENADSAVTVTNGTSVGDGQKEIAFGFMLPGLSESLALDTDKIKIPESFSISYEAVSHTKPQLMFAMIPLSFTGGENVLSSLFSDSEGMRDSLAEFGTLFSSVTGDSSLKSILSQSDEIAELANTAMQAMRSFTQQRALIDTLSKHLTSENAELIARFANELKDVEISKYAELFSDPTFRTLIEDMGTVSESLTALLPKLNAFAEDISSEEVKKSLESLPQTMEYLSLLSHQLQENKGLIDALQGLSQSKNAEAIARIFETAEGLLKDGTVEALSEFSKNSDELLFRFNKILEKGKEYSVFTEAPKDAETSVYFVFKTQ